MTGRTSNDTAARADRRGASPGVPRPGDSRIFAPAAQRNRQPILDVLARVLPGSGLVLEIASGTGEHAFWFAQHLRSLIWQPSDPDPAARRSIAAHATTVAGSSLRAPLDLDVTEASWPIERAEAIVCINMAHIAPWAATEGLIAGSARTLPPGGILYLYGPYKRGGAHTAPSNAAFDASLRRQNPAWGLRDVEAVTELAAARGLRFSEVVDMPANNLSLVFTCT